MNNIKMQRYLNRRRISCATDKAVVDAHLKLNVDLYFKFGEYSKSEFVLTALVVL